MSVAKAIIWGFTLSIVVCVVILAIGFLFRIDVGIPGFLSVTSSKTGAPQSDMQFSPLAPVVLTVVFAAGLWILGLIRGRVAKSDR